MGFVYAETKLVNAGDIAIARRFPQDVDQIRQVSIRVLVDSSSRLLSINEDIQTILQLPFVRRGEARAADGVRIECDIVGPLQVDWQGQSYCTEALVLPGNSEPLLGAILLDSRHAYKHFFSRVRITPNNLPPNPLRRQAR